MMETVDKQFRASVKVGEKTKCKSNIKNVYIEFINFKVGDELYGSTVLEKNKKYAEQGAALVAVKCLNITEQSIVWKEKENTLEISNGHKVS